jgi:hypothetical protein
MGKSLIPRYAAAHLRLSKTAAWNQPTLPLALASNSTLPWSQALKAMKKGKLGSFPKS